MTPKAKGLRLDERLASEARVSRTKAAGLIMSGTVTIDGRPATKAGQLVAADAALSWGDPPPVSRAAGKLAPVLRDWGIAVAGRIALDAGSSTGGFTEVLLQGGAKRVYAVDVGTGQLAWKLRQDPRVVCMERTDVRRLALPETPELATVDLSFISLRLALPSLENLLAPSSPVIALFKPQFEVGKDAANKGSGVITDEALISHTLEAFLAWATDRGWTHHKTAVSEVTGAKGNRERLLWLTSPPAG